MVNKYDSFIFDLDGTICNTLKDIASSVNYSLKYHHYKTYKVNDMKPFLGHGSKRLIEDALDKKLENYDSVFKVYMDKYKSNPVRYTKAYPIVTKFLIKAKEKGIKLFVFTNKPQVLASLVISKCFKENLFLEVIGVKDSTTKVKPDVEEFKLLTKKYNIDYTSSAYFGDSDVDLITAKNLNVRETYITTWGYQDYSYLKEYEIQPTKYLFKYKELLDIIK